MGGLDEAVELEQGLEGVAELGQGLKLGFEDVLGQAGHGERRRP